MENGVATGDKGVHGFHESKDSEGEIFVEAPEEIHTQESPLKLDSEQIINGEVHVDKLGDSGSLGVNGISNGDHEIEHFEEAIGLPGNERNETFDEVGVADGAPNVEDKVVEVVSVESNGLDNVGSVGNAEAVVNLGNDQTQEEEQDLVFMEPVDDISLADEIGNLEHNGKEVVLVESNGFDGDDSVGNSEVELREFSDIVADRDIEPSMNSTQEEGWSDAVPEKYENGNLAEVSLEESLVVHEKAEDVNVEQVESDVIEPSQGNGSDELIVHQDSESAELKEPSTNLDGEHQDHQNVQLKNSSTTEQEPSLKEVGTPEVEIPQSAEESEFSDIVVDRDIEPSVNKSEAEGRNVAVLEKSENGDLTEVSLGESPVVHEKTEDVNIKQVESYVIEPSQGNESDELIVHQDSESAELKEPSTNLDGEHQDHQNVQLKNSSTTEQEPSLKEVGTPEVEIPQSAEESEFSDIVVDRDIEPSVNKSEAEGRNVAVLEKSENGDLTEVSLGESPVVHEKTEDVNIKQVKSYVIEPSQGNESDELIVHQDSESAELKEHSANLDDKHQDHQNVQLKISSTEQEPSLKKAGTPEVEIPLSTEESEFFDIVANRDIDPSVNSTQAEGGNDAVPEKSENGDLAEVGLGKSSAVLEKTEDVNVKQLESDVIEPSHGNESDELIVHQDSESVELKEPSANLDGGDQDHQNVQLKISSPEQDPSLKVTGTPEVEIPVSAEESDTVKDDAAEPEAKDLQDSRPLLADRNIRECSSSHIELQEPAVQKTQKVENRGPGIQSAQNVGSSAGNSINPPRPAGLGSAPLLGSAPRALQQPRVNGSIPQRQTQLVEDPVNGEAEENDDEAREKLQMIRVKFLRLAHRLGQTPHNVVVAQVLYRLGLAEQLQGGNTTRVGAFSFDRASAMAEQLEAAGQEPLDFSCTIMVIGKTGVGKSATVNSIFDEVKFSTDAFNMGTKKVQDVVGTVQGIKVRVIDTPGLLPSWSDQRHNEKVLHSIKSFIKKTPPDIVLYLDRLDMQSRDFGDMPLLRTITEIFGPSIWFNAIVVLTHAASAPPDGPNGTASSYEMFVTQRSHMVQQAIRQAAGDMRLMNPVALVENHSACRTNRAGQRVLPNGQVWKPHLLLLSFASKILAEANTLLKLQDSPPGKPFATRSRAPPLPFLLSSLLQSRPQLKLPEEQFGSDEDALDEDLDEASDSDEESDYDELPPFKRLTRAQLAKLSKAQKKAYFDELEYREKLFMKKQLKEERKRRKLLKKMAAFAKDFPNEYNESAEEESGGAASVPVPMPDMALPTSFDSDNPTHRYRFLDSSNQWLVRPVLDTHGWDHDIGYEGINVERLFVIRDKIPLSFSGQVTKDKKEANAQMELAGSVKHGEGKATSLGFDMLTVGKDMAYTLRSETRFSNFRHNKTAAGLSVTLLGDALSAGVKIEDKLIVNKRFRMVVTGGAMTGRGDVAYGGSLEATLRDKDYPLGRMLSTLGLSIMDWHGDLAIGCNVQSQLPLGRASTVIARANLNNRGAGQVSIRLNSSEQLQIALFGLIPLFRKLVGYSQLQFGQ